ncbi:MAG TPA: helix-turn-helix transcriptional regulator [Alphaproteobacteria bacterium]|jgi:transcriptional regulator with XRE-family HTH domain
MSTVHPIVEELAAQRRYVKLTQGDVADRLGVSVAKVSQTERGHVNASLHFAEAYARALGLKIVLMPDRQERVGHRGVELEAIPASYDP